uniref:Uncharacterized protein n=1 Tax=Rhizophora mucronata TaxID=61149 RepID=A0A2P2QPV7_RHIMU
MNFKITAHPPQNYIIPDSMSPR